MKELKNYILESNKIKKEKSSEIKKNLDLSSDNEPKFFL